MHIYQQNGGGIQYQTTPALAAKDAEIARLRAEVEANRGDAERYRWLRNDAMTGTKHDPAVLKDGPTDCCEFMFGDELDAAIDTAMGGSQ